jgi:hypothetical protein
MPKYNVETDQGTFEVELDTAPANDAELQTIVQQHLASAPPAPPKLSGAQKFWDTVSSTYRTGMDAAEPAQTPGKKFLQSVVPIGGGGAGIASKLPALGRLPALSKVLGSAATGEAMGQIEGRPTGRGAMEGVITSLGASGLGKSLPWLARLMRAGVR